MAKGSISDFICLTGYQMRIFATELLFGTRFPPHRRSLRTSWSSSLPGRNTREEPERNSVTVVAGERYHLYRTVIIWSSERAVEGDGGAGWRRPRQISRVTNIGSDESALGRVSTGQRTLTRTAAQGCSVPAADVPVRPGSRLPS